MPGAEGVLDRAALVALARQWLARDPDATTRAELSELVAVGTDDELASRFGARLAFGTAGLRAELGAGPLRMNRLVVVETATGLVRFLRDRLSRPPRVVIGYDARHQSDVFAEDTAAVVAAAGGEAILFPAPGPTPLLAFAVLYLAADAAVMVTASHNPPRDNGYKVYLGDGAQIVAPVDAEIARRIDEVAAAGVPFASLVSPPPGASSGSPGQVVRLPDSVVERYLDTIVGQTVRPDCRRARVVYTPLHGVGETLLRRAFAAAGFLAPEAVPEQAEPDPDFPTVAFPNPEEPGAMDLALARAASAGADVVLANDPDADRLGVAIPTGGAGGWRQLDGNEIGALLADHLLRHGSGGSDRLVITTVVSSRLLQRLAAEHGVVYAETLTGFKWIVRPALAHPELRFIFGYEEALGYSVGPAVRDKDGIAAALVFAEVVATLTAEGSTVEGRLAEIAAQVGLHAGDGWSLRFAPGAPGIMAVRAAMDALRARTPQALGGMAVRRCRDLLQHHDVADSAPSDALIWELETGARVVIRPSGTEPKLKVYAEVVVPLADGVAGYDPAVEAARTTLAALRADVTARLAPGAPGCHS